MRRMFSMISMMTYLSLSLSAQTPTGVSYEKTKSAPAMRWTCPDIDKYQGLLYSLRSNDYKVYANNVKERFDLFSPPSSPADKFLVTQAVLDIENPMYNPTNLLNYIVSWVKKNKKDWYKGMKIDYTGRKINTSASINVASHVSLGINKVFVTPDLVIALIEDDKLLISFLVDCYKNEEHYKSDNRIASTVTVRVSDVYPFVPKSAYKITYAKAYVGSYQYFWNFIDELCKDLNTNFTRDAEMLSQLHYQYSKDSLIANYGEPTKVITGLSKTLDVHNEMYFFEEAQKVVFMGKTIDFRDIMNCEIVDDPKFIPGRTTTGGGGISFFGIMLGGAETTRTPDKTIHNYVVDVKIDNLGTPFIRIATGQSDDKATEIASVFEYILRHQQGKKAESQKAKAVTRRRK